eukprot:983022-Pyramimonas_sp.AAC.1
MFVRAACESCVGVPAAGRAFEGAWRSAHLCHKTGQRHWGGARRAAQGSDATLRDGGGGDGGSTGC